MSTHESEVEFGSGWETGGSGYRHKIVAPKGYLLAISRSGLVTRILDETQARVVVLQAPAGHGKTTVLQQLQASCEAQGFATGWLSVDESDNDIRRFYTHLRAMVTAMRTKGHATKAAPGDRSASEGEFRSDWVISQLLEIGKPVRIFFDDVHAINSRPTLNVIREILENAPEGMQFVLASRNLPDVGISRLVVNRQALVLRADDLCFTREEVSSFFAKGSVEVSDYEVGMIHRKTDGWPAALQLYLLALSNPAVRESIHRSGDYRPSDLAEYLSENVLAAQAPEVRDFLLKSAFLSRMSAELCDDVLGRSDSEEMLNRIEKAGLFVKRLDSDKQWFVYHALFSTFLEEQMRLSNARLGLQIRRTAAKWFRDRGYLEEALRHYSAAGNHADAADVLDEWSDRLVPAAHLVTVERWSERIPFKELEGRPALTIKIIWALTFLRRFHKQKPLLGLLKRQQAAGQTHDSTADPAVVLAMVAIIEDDLLRGAKIVKGVDTQATDVTPFRAFELGAVSNARGYADMAAGRFSSAHENLRRARRISDPAGTSFTWAYSISKSSLTLIAQGELQEALVQLRASMADPRMYGDESVSQASLVATHILALYEANELDAAEVQFLRFRDIIANAALHDYLAVAYISIARIYDERGQPSKALEMLDEAESICISSQWPRASRILNWERVRRELVSGEYDRALAIVDREDGYHDNFATDWIRFSEEVNGGAIGRIRVLAHSGKLDEALESIERLSKGSRRDGRIQRLIKLSILTAIAHEKNGSRDVAATHLEEAIRLAAPGRFVRSFLEEGDVIKPMVRMMMEPSRTSASMPAKSPQRQLLSDLQSAFGIEAPSGPEDSAPWHRRQRVIPAA